MTIIEIKQHPADREEPEVTILLPRRNDAKMRCGIEHDEVESVALTTREAIDIHHELHKYLERKFPDFSRT